MDPYAPLLRLLPAPLLGAVLCLGASAAPSPAEEYAERAARLDSKDLKGWLALADFCEQNRLWVRWEETLRKAVDADPKDRRPHERLGETCLKGAWMSREEAFAREEAEQAGKGLAYYGRKWMPAKEAARLQAEDRKRAGWDLDFRLDTDHLSIYSGRPLPFTRRLAALLEEEFSLYRTLYEKVWKLEPTCKPLQVFLFGNRDDFLRVMKAAGAPMDDFIRGGYNSGTQILYLGINLAESRSDFDPAMTTKVAVHETLHALDDQLAHIHGKRSPLWLQEGRANYLGYSVLGDRILPGAMRFPSQDAGVLDTLRAEFPSASLADLMNLDLKRFMGEGVHAHYGLSWAWVHFLQHGQGGKLAPRFAAFLSGLSSKTSVRDFEEKVGKLPELEPAFRQYVERELLPAPTP